MAAQTGAEHEPATAPIDRRYLARFTLGDTVLEREILEVFESHLPLYVQQLQRAATPSEWKNAAHTIKGSALAVGARELARTAQAAEELDVKGDPMELERLRRDAIDAVTAASEKARRFIACLFATA